jgi:hypothetical protein
MDCRTRLALLASLCCAPGLAAPQAFAGPGIIINEYLYDPAPNLTGDANKDTVVDTGDDEFVEFVNVSGGAIDMSGWRIRDEVAVRHVFPAGTAVGAGCAIVVFGGGTPPPNFFSGAVVQTASTGFLGLNNNGDSIILEDASLVLIAAKTYSDEGNVDQSYSRDPDLTGVNFVQHSTATNSGGSLFSPGTRIDGSSFGACVAPGPDFDGDGHPDSLDNCPNIANPDQADCNLNGLGDVCEIDGDPTLDCDNNGVLDSCESGDCNENFIPDITDICLGFSLDCNENNIPDECEADCNGNFVPDECDITSGTSQDVNNDGIPDECRNLAGVIINEILADPAPGTAGDANGDTIPNDSQGVNSDEFVEIVNSSLVTVNISGWTLSDNVGPRHTFPTNTVLQPNCGIVIFGGGTPIGQFGGMIRQTASTGTLSLNNAGDTITIRDNASLVVAIVTYGDEGGDDQSLTRFPDINGDFVQHTVATPGVLFSPGLRHDESQFGGCPALLPDADDDGVPDVDDNCVNTPNPLQADCDEDGIGNACDTDPDLNGNGIPDVCEVGTPGNVRINEARVDQSGADNDEYFEIKGPPLLSLNGLTLIVIGDGAGSGTIESVTSLSGQQIPADGHFLCVESSFTLAPPVQRDLIANLNFENNDNVTFVLVTNFAGVLNQDLDTDDDGTLDVVPWSGVVDAVGILADELPPKVGDDWAYGAALGFEDVGPDPVAFDPGHLYRCETQGLWTFGAFDPAGGDDAPGVVNPTECPGSNCPADITGNGVVNIDDLLAVINAWGACANPNDCPADIAPPGGNDVVNIDDLLTVINAWGNCPL